MKEARAKFDVEKIRLLGCFFCFFLRKSDEIHVSILFLGKCNPQPFQPFNPLAGLLLRLPSCILFWSFDFLSFFLCCGFRMMLNDSWTVMNNSSSELDGKRENMRKVRAAHCAVR